MRIVLARIENLRQEADVFAVDRSPFASIQSRIKTFESAANKCLDRGNTCDMKAIKKLHDIAGIRIITLYKDDIYRIRDALVRQPSIEVLEERDYVANPKDNGYRSLHLIISVHVYFCESTRSVPVEVQIRTKAMDLWASVEHDIKYKNDAPSKEAPQMFARVAKILEDFDEKAIRLRDDKPCN
jgi:ppGpp synthetase/RelA/SpoT-type nucleotidyltranferase